jgi:two-component system sensor histidine kinase GlrK
MRVGLKIFLAQAVLVLVVAGVAVWSLGQVGQLIVVDRDITVRTAEALRLEVSVRELLRRTAALERRFVVFGDREYGAIPATQAQHIRDDLGRLAPLLASDPERQRLRQAEAAFSRYRAAVAQGRTLLGRGEGRRAGEVLDAQALPAADQAIEALDDLVRLTQATLDRTQTQARAALSAAQIEAERITDRTWTAVWVSLGTAILVALSGTGLIALRMTRALRRLSQATGEVAEGAFRPVAVTSRDEIGDLARAFNTMAARLRELDEMKEQFYATVSHELKSPLASARESASLLRSGAHGALSPKQDRLAGIIQSSTERLLRLVDDILDLSRLSVGALPLDLRTMRLDRAGARAVEELRVLAEELKVNLALEQGSGDFEMVGDEDRIVQVLVNLLGNAVRFTPEAGAVTVRLEDRATDLAAIVEDTGVGIPAEEVPLIFERYRQAHRGRGGTGLGLAIVRALVEAHGGRVEVQSREGQGSRFTVTLPRRGPGEEG